MYFECFSSKALLCVGALVCLTLFGCRTATPQSQAKSFYDEIASQPGNGITIMTCTTDGATYCLKNSQLKLYYWKTLAELNCPGGRCACRRLKIDSTNPDFAAAFVNCAEATDSGARGDAQELLQTLFASRPFFGKDAILSIAPN